MNGKGSSDRTRDRKAFRKNFGKIKWGDTNTVNIPTVTRWNSGWINDFKPARPNTAAAKAEAAIVQGVIQKFFPHR